MRAAFGVLSLLLALLIVGVLVKKQLTAGAVPAVTAQPAAGADPAATIPSTSPGATPQQQNQQIQQQVKQSIEKSMQQARPVPDEN